jgi:Acetyltransferase (GNAT) domain
VNLSLFHEPWWLSAVSGGRAEEVAVESGGKIVGRLPYVPLVRGPFRALRMPAFTHMLGPVVDTGEGKPQTRLNKRLSLVRALIDKLPPHAFFHQHLDPGLDDGLAVADGLAFQERAFQVSAQYTFEIDCRRPLQELRDALYLKTRQHIRKSEKEYQVRTVESSKIFIDFYDANLRVVGRKSLIDFSHFPAVHAECAERRFGEILGAFDSNGAPAAMTYLVWGHGVMYYLLSTRRVDAHDHGAVSLLLWSAIERAHNAGLVLDLDGVYSSGTVRFLSNFGGRIRTRLVIRRAAPLYGALQSLKRLYSPHESHNFT